MVGTCYTDVDEFDEVIAGEVQLGLVDQVDGDLETAVERHAAVGRRHVVLVDQRDHRHRLRPTRLRASIHEHDIDARKTFFTNRVVDIWNCLPTATVVVQSHNVSTFKQNRVTVIESRQNEYRHHCE